MNKRPRADRFEWRGVCNATQSRQGVSCAHFDGFIYWAHEKWRIESVYFMWFGAARFGGRTDASDGLREVRHSKPGEKEGQGGLDGAKKRQVSRPAASTLARRMPLIP